jgi:dipeptidase E
LGKTLKYLDLVDNAKVFPYRQIKKNSWKGLGIINFTIIPHYQSNHPETKMVEKVVEEYKQSNSPFKTLKDGQVLILEI